MFIYYFIFFVLPVMFSEWQNRRYEIQQIKKKLTIIYYKTKLLNSVFVGFVFEIRFPIRLFKRMRKKSHLFSAINYRKLN